ncbi:chloride channel protein [Synechococcus sp. RSCCF101]|uniref:chloride channel protein n=1 Tax=Synechococcus sp. RSCCF101 TaxID=2511069 RepID=UPI001246E468|nr:chloride channel protein [Synechococcus sp. RSCCF101]QEY31965.1 chloride channel protein [Synechococcus sp. RSCCF101]
MRSRHDRPAWLALLTALALAVLVGAAGGSLAAFSLRGLDALLGLVWGKGVLAGAPSSRTLLAALAITLPVGLGLAVLRRTGGAPGAASASPALLPELPDTLRELRGSAGLSSAGWWRQLLSGALALLGGAPIGPEALLTRLVALISHGLWRGRDQALPAAAVAGSLGIFQAPLLGGAVLAGRRWSLLWRWLPGTLAGLAGFVTAGGGRALGGLAGVPYQWPDGGQQGLAALSVSVVAGLLGLLLGRVALAWRGLLRRCLRDDPPLWLTPATGLLLAFSGWCLPLAVFSGEQQLRPLLLDAPTGAPLLLLSGLAKLLLAALCLETGWRGGLFFPAILASACVGLGAHGLLPWWGEPQSWVAGVTGGTLSALLGAPVVALVLGLALLEGHAAGALLIGVLIGQLSTRVLSRGRLAASE